MTVRLTLKSAGVFLALLYPAIASAHVVVTPAKADVGQELVFSVSVPNEQQTPVVSLEIDIPEGVTDVTPTTSNGWTIEAPTGKDGDVTSLKWTGGNIPVGQRQDFSFGAQVPAKAGELDWKAFQTYGDGTVVHWDQKPAGSDDATGNAGPYSVTQVANDLTGSSNAAKTTDSDRNALLAFGLSALALVISIGGVTLGRRKR